MKEIVCKIEIEIEGGGKSQFYINDIVDIERWKEIDKLCERRAISTYEVLKEYLEGLTKEKAEEILLGMDV